MAYMRRHKSRRKVLRRDFTITFDTEGLADGVELFTPAAGELIFAYWIEKVELWDGGEADVSEVDLMLGLQGKTALIDDEHVDAPAVTAEGPAGFVTLPFIDLSLYLVGASRPMVASVNLYDAQTSDLIGPPDSTQGELTITFLSV